MPLRRPLVWLSPLLALACHRVPATLAETDAEPVARGSVFVESPPQRERGVTQALSQEAIALYTCWFARPYEYMFGYDGSALEINGRAYGMLMAGTRGILYYGNLNECAGALVGQQPSNYADPSTIGLLAGVSVTLPNPNLPFDTVNPEIITWARATLLPSADQTIDGVPVQLAYERVFSRFFRLMGESLFYVLESGPIDIQANKYIEGADQRGVDGIDWLEQRYTGIPRHGGSWDGTTLTAPMAAGFWLRRALDGSYAACWHGLRDVYERYDPAWLADLRARYPKAASIVAQLPDDAN
jgi:hypothetical protein